MTTRLVIKGTLDQARVAAAVHGIVLVNERKHPNYNETVADTESDPAKVRAWFAINNDSPFPVGTLLFYQEEDDEMIRWRVDDFTPSDGEKFHGIASDHRGWLRGERDGKPVFISFNIAASDLSAEEAKRAVDAMVDGLNREFAK